MSVAIGVARTRPIALGPRGVLCAAVAWLLLAVAVSQHADVATWAPDAAPPPTATTADSATGSVSALPMAWVANTGQTDAAVRYWAQGLGYATFLTDTEAVVRLDDAVVRLGFEGASTAPTLGTAEPLAATVSSFAGSDRSAWQSAAAAAEVVEYEDLWPGIDATFRGSGTHVEWDYHVAAGADPSTAGINVAGPDHISVDGDRATLASEGGELTLTIPAVWQTLRDGTRVDRDAQWVLDGDTLRVVPEDWDPSLPGVIDPTLDWSTYLGGGPGGEGHDRAASIAIDAAGNAFVTGSTESVDFPTTSGAFDNTLEGDGPDAFVTKVDPTGGALVFSTILGGSGDDWGDDIAVDATGNVYVVADTEDGVTDYPTTAGAYDTAHNGSWDAAVTKLDPTGGSLLYSTFLGGAAFDEGTGVAVDGASNAYITGYATDTTTDYPTTPGAYDTTPNGSTDAFVTKLDATGSALVFSTLLGGSSGDRPRDLAIDSSGRADITGDTFDGTTDYPTTAGAYDTTHNGTFDVFVTRLDAAGSTLDYSTLIGSAANDFAYGLALDGAGDAYVTGETVNPFSGAAYPTTPGAYDTSFNGVRDVFVTKLDGTGSSLDFSTLLGGGGQDIGQGIATDPTGHVYVTGSAGADFPTTPGAYDTGSAGFVTKLDPTGSSLDYSGRLAGGGVVWGNAIAANAAGNAYVTGSTQSSAFPTTAGAFDTSHNGANDVFVTKLNTAGSALDYSTLLGGSDGSGSDGITGVAVDASGVYVAGTTDSNYFPTTAGAIDTGQDDGDDIFVAKLDPSGGSLIYSAVLGGSGRDQAGDIAIDANGHAYVTGMTEDWTTDFPTTAGAFDTSHNGGPGIAPTDVFVTRLNPTGTALDYSTFLGGARADFGNGIVVDAAGSAYVTGSAGTAFPTTPGVYDSVTSGDVFDGGGDAFITKLTPAGDALEYSTLLGGGGTQGAEDIAVDAAGNTYVTGVAYPGLPVTPGAFDTTHNGGIDPDSGTSLSDAFVSKMSSTGTALVYSTYLGGLGEERGQGIAIDASGNVSVTGETSSGNYPTTPGAFDTTYNGGQRDAFVTRLNPSGSNLIFSTLLGSSDTDSGNDIAVDAAGYSYITGATRDSTSDYPVTSGALDTTPGSSEAFLTRLAPSGATLAYSTFIGGSGGDSGTALAMTSPESITVAGSTGSADFATTPGAYDTDPAVSGAGFVARFDLSTPAVGGCRNTTTAGAEIGMFPAQPGAQSGLRVACRFESAAGESVAPVAFTVHDFGVATFHNGSARTVSTTGAIASGATTFTVASFAGTAGWVNRPITTVGAVPGLVPRTFVRSISGAGLVTLSAPTTAAIPAATSFKIDNTRARSVVDGVTTASSSTLTSASANFTSGDTGLSVSGTNIADGTTATFVNATTITLSNAATASGTSQTITFGATLVNTTTRAVNDAANTSATVITSSAARFKTDDIGLRVTGPGIPANAFITAVTGTTATTTGGLTPNTAPQTIVIGEPSATAPTPGDTAANLGLQLDRDPAFFAGADPCANNTAESLALVGLWNNPGAFEANSFIAPQPAATKAIGQIRFHGGVLPLAAYVIERPGLTPGDPIGAAHYDLVIPFLSTDVGTCKTPTSPGLGWSLGVHGQTSSQATLPQGTGKPGTTQLRSIIENPTGGYSSTVYLTSDDPAVTLTPASQFNRLCLYPPGPATIGFTCGNG